MRDSSCSHVGTQPWELLALLVGVVVAAWLTGCSATQRAATPATTTAAANHAGGTPINIGYLADANDTTAPIAAGMHLGTDLAVQQINADGGINGHPLHVTYVDPRGDPSTAGQMATDLVRQNQADVLMGGVLSSECLVLQHAAAGLKTVYLPAGGCAAEEFASQSCNRYAFRFQPVGRQTIAPLAEYIVKTYGTRWAMAYSDYAYGQSQLNAYRDELARYGASVTVPIAIPNTAPGLGPFIARVPTDGSVDGIILNGLVASDLTRMSLALGQHGILPGVQAIGNSGRDVYGGAYPEFLTGSVNSQTYIDGSPPNNPYGEAYEKAWRGIAQQEPEWSNTFGGPDRAMAFQGYPQYTAINVLKTAMVASHFSGRVDTEALIQSLERVNLPLGPDAPGGAVIMNKQDHQGAQTVYVYKVSGPQQEELLLSVPADRVPFFNTCQV